MSSDLFEENVGRLVRQAALPVDDALRARARARFLRAAEPAPSSRSRSLAIVAAAALIGALFYGATLVTEEPSTAIWTVSRAAQDPPTTFVPVIGSGGDRLLRGVLRMTKENRPERRLRFEGQSPLPEGLVFILQIRALEQRFERGRLVDDPREAPSYSPVLRQGAFDFEWRASKPAVVTLRITAPDSAQDMDLVHQLQVQASEREWSFTFSAWDNALVPQLEPQLEELADLVRQARDLCARVEAAAATLELFKASEKSLIAEARKLESRANGFAGTGLYPAATLQVAYVAQDLAGSMAIFTWKDGRFDGPRSYYTNHERAKTFRGDLFEFSALRRYLDEATVAAGREFDLWICRESARAGSRPELADAVDRCATRPGVAEFADRLKSGVPDPTLVEEIRRISK